MRNFSHYICTMDNKLKQYIEQQILPRYAAFDRAHRTDHVQTVIDRSLALAESYQLDKQMVYTIAAYHDTGLVNGREHHHIDSGKILAADTHLRRHFSAEQIDLMREAVEDHRASSDHEPRTIYGRIVAEADRLIDTKTIIRRTVQYSLAHYPTLDREGHFDRCCEHMQRKYAEGGYLKLWIPESDNAQRLAQLRAIIGDREAFRGRFDAIFDHETAPETTSHPEPGWSGADSD